MTKVYAMIGKSMQQVGGECPSGFIEMESMRPEEGHWIAMEGGVWCWDSSVNLRLRQKAYREESDPLGFEYLFDKTPETEEAWREKVLEIKARYPLRMAKPIIKE